jgi:hypothetical protein
MEYGLAGNPITGLIEDKSKTEEFVEIVDYSIIEKPENNSNNPFNNSKYYN